MQDIKSEVRAALKQIDGVNVSYFYPESFENIATTPAIAYRESSNIPDSYADDDEYTSEISYRIDIYAKTSVEAGRIAKKTANALKKIGMKRGASYDLYDADNRAHKTMSFSIIVDESEE